MVRYVLKPEVKKVWNTHTLDVLDGGCTDIPYSDSPQFVDIMEVSEKGLSMKVKVYCNDGKVVVGWLLHQRIKPSIGLFNEEELWDGRFNLSLSGVANGASPTTNFSVV